MCIISFKNVIWVLFNNSLSPGYYGSGGTYPYQAYGVGDGTWSNGTDPMTFLSGYPHDSYMDGKHFQPWGFIISLLIFSIKFFWHKIIWITIWDSGRIKSFYINREK